MRFSVIKTVFMFQKMKNKQTKKTKKTCLLNFPKLVVNELKKEYLQKYLPIFLFSSELSLLNGNVSGVFY